MLRLLILTTIATLTFAEGNTQTADSLYSTAFKLYKKGDYKKALTLLEPALLSDSTNIDYLILKGNTLRSLKEFQAAYDIYSRLIELHPKESPGYNQRGLLLQQLMQTEESIKDFTAALAFEQTDLNRLTLYLNRGASKQTVRDFKGAYADYYEALKIDSLNIGALNNLAVVADEVGKGELTLVYLNKILRIDSTFAGAYGNIGFKYQEMGDYKTAISYFNKVISLDKNDPLGYSNRSFNYYKLKEYPNALADINISIKLYPSNSYAFRVRALIYLDLNQQQKACADLAEALRLGFTTMYGDEVEKLKQKHCK